VNTAAKVAEHKSRNPHLYCSKRGCLWKTGGPDCPRHAVHGHVRAYDPLPQIPMFPPECCQDCGAPFNNANATPSGRCVACEA